MRRFWISAAVLAAIVTAGSLSRCAFSIGKPRWLGVTDGKLAPLPRTPNAVASYQAGHYPQADPLTYTDSLESARARLVSVMEGMSRSTIEAVDGNYVHATFRSRTFRFVDDVEFLFDDEQKIIHFRSGARMGIGDAGVNPKRMERIRSLFTTP